jgi:hypothetical protein
MGGELVPCDSATVSDEKQTDGVSRYIDWAISKDFGVIDINVPHYITHPEVCLTTSTLLPKPWLTAHLAGH